MKTEKLNKKINKLSSKYYKLLGEKEALESILELDEKKLEVYKKHVKCDEKVLDTLYAIAEIRKGDIKNKIEKLVTKGIRAVFDREDLEFKLEISISRGDVAVKPVIVCEYNNKTLETDIIEGHGGGLGDVVSFVLRVVVLSLIRPQRARLLVLDEPFKHVSSEYLPAVAELMKELRKITKLQIIMVTHKSELAECADVIYKSKLLHTKETVFTREG